MDNDLIRRGSVTDFLKIWNSVPQYNWGEKNVIGAAIQTVENIPAADVRPVVRGKWVEHGRYRPPTCSNCGSGCLLNYESDYHKSDYCPHCGADMMEEKE